MTTLAMLEEETLGTAYGDAMSRKNRRVSIHDQLLDTEKHGEAEVHRRLWKYINAESLYHALQSDAITAEMLVHIYYTSARSRDESASAAAIYGHPNFPATIIEALFSAHGADMTAGLLANRNCPVSVLEDFYATGEHARKFYTNAAANPNLPLHILEKMLIYGKESRFGNYWRILTNPNVPVEVLASEMIHELFAVLRNPATPSWVLTKIAEEHSPMSGKELDTILSHPQLTRETFYMLCSDVTQWRSKNFHNLSSHPFMTEELYARIEKDLEKILSDSQLTSNQSKLTQYAQSGDMGTIRHLFMNPNTSSDNLRTAYDRLCHGDLQAERAEWNNTKIRRIDEIITFHPNISEETLFLAIKNHITFTNGDLNLFYRASSPRHFLACLEGMNNRPIDLLAIIRSQHTPLTLFPLIREKVETSTKSKFEYDYQFDNAKSEALTTLTLVQELRTIDESAKIL